MVNQHSKRATKKNYLNIKQAIIAPPSCSYAQDEDQLPFLLAGEKKLKTGEKMVPSNVVRGGLLGTSVCSSNFPFGFTSLL